MPNDKAHATAAFPEPDADYVAQLPPSRPRLQTLAGVAPAAPIVVGRPDGSRSHRSRAATVASLPSAFEHEGDPQPAPMSRVRPKVERPELPRATQASKHTLDAVSIQSEASSKFDAADSTARKGRRGPGALLGALAIAAVLSVVAIRRAPHAVSSLPALAAMHLQPTLGAEPTLAITTELPPVSPAPIAESPLEDTPTATVQVPTATSPGHKRASKRAHAHGSASK